MILLITLNLVHCHRYLYAVNEKKVSVANVSQISF